MIFSFVQLMIYVFLCINSVNHNFFYIFVRVLLPFITDTLFFIDRVSRVRPMHNL